MTDHARFTRIGKKSAGADHRYHGAQRFQLENLAGFHMHELLAIKPDFGFVTGLKVAVQIGLRLARVLLAGGNGVAKEYAGRLPDRR